MILAALILLTAGWVVKQRVKAAEEYIERQKVAYNPKPSQTAENAEEEAPYAF